MRWCRDMTCSHDWKAVADLNGKAAFGTAIGVMPHCPNGPIPLLSSAYVYFFTLFWVDLGPGGPGVDPDTSGSPRAFD